MEGSGEGGDLGILFPASTSEPLFSPPCPFGGAFLAGGRLLSQPWSFVPQWR